MRHALLRSVVAAALAGPLTACGGSDGACTPEAFRSALASASAGTTVRVGSCRIAGAFEVPAGVSVAGTEGSVLASVEGGAPVLDVDATARSSIADLRVEVDHGGLGIRGVGTADGTLVVARVTVQVTRGVGIGVISAKAELRDVELAGPIDASNATFAPMSPAETGAFGLVGRDLGAASLLLENVHVAGFAVAGVSVGGGSIVWQGRETGADVEGNRGVGIALFGTDATLMSVEVTGMLAGVGLPGIGVSVSDLGSDPGTLDGTDLVVSAGEGYGLFSDGADVVLASSRFADLGLAGIRAQGGTVSATDLACERDGGAGLLAIDTESVHVERGRFDAQVTRPLASSITTVDIGDGIQIVRDPASASAPPMDLRLVDVTLTTNERAGLLLDAADGAVARLELVSVRVSSEGAAFGAVTQTTPVPPGWDAMVVREGTAAANDALFPGSVPVAGIMMPPGLVAVPPSF